MQGAQQLLFPPFRVDLITERLWQGEREIPLRPKTFAVLRYLLEQREKSVNTAALLQAVWPDVIVSEAVPRMCIRELRLVLGDDATQPRFIATHPRRGYRWIAPLTSAPPIADSRLRVSGLQSAPREPLLVGREAQLAQLHGWLEETRNGARHIVFVTGEPGIGKTTLVEAFLAQVTNADGLSIVQGQCVEQYGAGEAYLPILEALERLGRVLGPEQLAGTLRQFAPMWLMQLPSLTRPAERAQLQQQLAGATRHRMLRELAQALEVLTAEYPLIVWLEDLHWSDYSTLDLVSTLARRRESARLLVIGTYRPVNVLLSDHPLRVVKQELQLHGHCQELVLGLLTEMEVTAYLRTRLAGGAGRVPLQHLARLIHQHTDGNPLFMVSVVNDLIERGALVEHAGQWDLRVAPEALAVLTPANIRHMIEQQLERLSPEDQRMLEAASVAGVAFSAATVATGTGRRPKTVEEQCAQLSRRGQWLKSQGAIEWPDGTLAAGYCFLHSMYQEVLYERVPPGIRAQLHERIGQRLEAAYAQHIDDIVAELALHFERGRNVPKAVRYLEHAGKAAVGRSAPREAVQHFTKAIGLLTTWPDSPARQQHELSLQLMRGAALMATKGLAAPEVAYVYARAWDLCQQLGEAAQTFAVVTGLFTFHTGRGDVQKGHEFAEQGLRLAEQGHDPALLLQAHRSLGSSLFYLGRYEEALVALDEALASKPQDAATLSAKGEVLRILGRYTDALAILDQALSLESDVPDTLATKGQVLRALKRNDEAAMALLRAVELAPELEWAYPELGMLDCYEQMLAILDRALEQNRRNAVLLRIKGRVLCEVGDFESAADLLKQATERNPEDRDNFHLLGWALENLGRERAEDAKQAYEAALARNPPPLAELWSRKGLADALRLAGDMSGARKQYSEVLQEVERHEEPADPDILWFLGWCHYQLENYDEAARLYVDALSLSSDMSEMIPTQFDLGLALLCGKRYDPGLQEYQWGLQLTSKRSPMRQRGLLRVALIDFAQAMEKSPALRNQTEVFKVEAVLNDAYNKALQSLAPQPTPAASTVS